MIQRHKGSVQVNGDNNSTKETKGISAGVNGNLKEGTGIAQKVDIDQSERQKEVESKLVSGNSGSLWGVTVVFHKVATSVKTITPLVQQTQHIFRSLI